MRAETARPRPPPTSVIVWGSPRADLDRLALGLARVLASDLFWFHVHSADPVEPDEVPVLETINPDRAVHVTPPEVALDDRLGNLALWGVLAGPRSELSATHLADYFRIPERIRRAVESTGPVPEGIAVVVANGDFATSFYAGTPGELAPVLDQMKKLGVSVLVTNGRVPRGNEVDFEVVFAVEPGSDPSSATVDCTRSTPAYDPWWRVGHRSSLSDFLRSLAR